VKLKIALAGGDAENLLEIFRKWKQKSRRGGENLARQSNELASHIIKSNFPFVALWNLSTHIVFDDFVHLLDCQLNFQAVDFPSSSLRSDQFEWKRWIVMKIWVILHWKRRLCHGEFKESLLLVPRYQPQTRKWTAKINGCRRRLCCRAALAALASRSLGELTRRTLATILRSTSPRSSRRELHVSLPRLEPPRVFLTESFPCRRRWTHSS
jgi:hypothetical protein